MTEFQTRVFAIVRRIPAGKVVSYGGVAALMGQPRAARGVGAALRAIEVDDDLPWWRVINRNGEISISHHSISRRLQRELLEQEGVAFGPTGRVDWDRFGWDGE